MKNTKCLFLIALMAVTIILSGQQDTPHYRVLFEKAKFTMETKGDLNGAIDLFNEIIKEYPDQREYAAKSQLNIGLCYEKLGLLEAQKAYRKVVENYPEQTEEVKLANEKLALLLRAESLSGKENKEFIIRRIKEGLDMGFRGSVSPDGRYFSYADDALDLAIYEIATGNKHIIVEGDVSSDAYTSVISPDGKLVAYMWYQNGLYDLRVVDMEGNAPRVLSSYTKFEWFEIKDWSPDSKSVLTYLYREDTCQMALVSVRDSSIHILRNFVGLEPGPAFFSPDGRYIAYTLQQSLESGKSDIFAFDFELGNETCLVQDVADDIVLDWTPDGKGIMFLSDRTGTKDAWWLKVIEGKPHGIPELIKPDLGTDIIPMGFTENGSYYYAIQKEMKDIYIAEIEIETGKLISAPRLVTQLYAGSNYGPNWSPDGKQLLYLSQRASGAWGARTICLYSPDNGKVQELFSELNQIAFACWCPDGRSLLAGAANPDGGQGIFQIDVETGNFELLLPVLMGWGVAMSYDGKAIYYYGYDPTPKKLAIVMRDLESGLEKELNSLILDSSYYTTGFVLSPDGQKIAFAVTEPGSTATKVMPSAGGEACELLRGDTKLILPRKYSIAWSPDGQSVLFVKPETPGGSKTELWRIPLQADKPYKLELTAEN
ncbi:MAG: PD40 domain-containing protein, partial [Bacteroidales bacterium]|nr:PD40 domain-containing protein [Bacteroidales bacterium]